jgi:hypothetical protein
VQDVHLVQEPDSILWKWTASGSYTTKSAYAVQFQGTFCSFNAQAIWKAYAEGKHRIFVWLLAQSKILMADRLLQRHWPCNPMCVLCDQVQESAVHLCLQCVFAREVWVLVARWTEGKIMVPAQDFSLEQWWNKSISAHQRKDKRRVAAILLYTAWHIWKEQNRWIFEGFSALPARVFALIKEDLKL